MLEKITALIGIEQIDHIVPKTRKRLCTAGREREVDMEMS